MFFRKDTSRQHHRRVLKICSPRRLRELPPKIIIYCILPYLQYHCRTQYNRNGFELNIKNYFGYFPYFEYNNNRYNGHYGYNRKIWFIWRNLYWGRRKPITYYQSHWNLSIMEAFISCFAPHMIYVKEYIDNSREILLNIVITKKSKQVASSLLLFEIGDGEIDDYVNEDESYKIEKRFKLLKYLKIL